MAKHSFTTKLYDKKITFLVPPELVGKRVIITVTDELEHYPKEDRKTISVNEITSSDITSTPNEPSGVIPSSSTTSENPKNLQQSTNEKSIESLKKELRDKINNHPHNSDNDNTSKNVISYVTLPKTSEEIDLEALIKELSNKINNYPHKFNVETPIHEDENKVVKFLISEFPSNQISNDNKQIKPPLRPIKLIKRKPLNAIENPETEDTPPVWNNDIIFPKDIDIFGDHEEGE